MILAIQTADQTTRLWLISPLKDPASASANSLADLPPTLEWESGRQLTDQLLTRLADLLQEHEATLADLTGFIIFSGPGSFTSLRIGHTVVNALADSLGIPVVGAQGEDWIATGLAALPKAEIGHPALPHYGAEAHITRPKS